MAGCSTGMAGRYSCARQNDDAGAHTRSIQPSRINRWGGMLAQSIFYDPVRLVRKNSGRLEFQTPFMDQSKIRAWYAHRQGLDGSLDGKSAAEVLGRVGWARSVGGTG